MEEQTHFKKISEDIEIEKSRSQHFENRTLEDQRRLTEEKERSEQLLQDIQNEKNRYHQ